MERESVVSSIVSEVGYNEHSRTLELLFKSGAIYLYYFVPAEVHRSLMLDEEPGNYWAQNIKHVYDYHRIAEPYDALQRRSKTPKRRNRN